MTEYWVSQGNKWCDFCKIFIQNNPSSIRNHELGQRHRECVNKKLADMRAQNVAKEKEQKEAARALQQIEDKAKRSYQKDIATFQEAGKSNVQALNATEDGQGKWEYNSTSGYYYNQTNGLYYDSNSGFYYSDAIGKWVTQEEAYAANNVSSDRKVKEPLMKKPVSAPGAEKRDIAENQNGAAPGPVGSATLNPSRSVKGAPSSLQVGKRKRQDEKPKKVSEEEAAALRAREAARKRVEEREKPLLGLYNQPM